MKYIIDAINLLNKYFDDYVAMYDDISRIIVSYDHGVLIINIEMKTFDIVIKWPIPDKVKEFEGNGVKTDYICLGVNQIINKILNREKDD